MIFRSVRFIKLAAAVCVLGGAVQAQAQTTYDVTYSQTFTGFSFGSPYTAVLSGSFTATDTDSNGSLSAAEIAPASFTFNLSGDLGAANFTGVPPVQITEFNWVIGDTNLTGTTSNVSIIAAPPSGIGMQWYAGRVQGMGGTGEPLGQLYLFNNEIFPVNGADPSLASVRPTFSAIAQPIPEPQTYLLMLAGIAGLAAFVRRKAG